MCTESRTCMYIACILVIVRVYILLTCERSMLRLAVRAVVAINIRGLVLLYTNTAEGEHKQNDHGTRNKWYV